MYPFESREFEFAEHFGGYPKSTTDRLLHLCLVISERFPEVDMGIFPGTNQQGKQVSNATVGFGAYQHRFADGRTQKLFLVGVSAGTAGLSIYFLNLPKHQSLKDLFGSALGSAKRTGYCIKFSRNSSIDTEVLLAGIAKAYSNFSTTTH